MTYLILNPNGKKIANIVRSWGLEFVELREGDGCAESGTIIINDASDLRSLERAAASLHFERPIRGIISCHESTMIGAAYLRAMFGLPGISFGQILPFINKYLMKSRAEAAGIPVAPYQLLQRSHLAAITDDVIVKPIASSSCIGTRRYSRSEAKALLAKSPDGLHLLEAAIDIVAEYHVDSVFESGELLWGGVSRYLRPPLSACGGAGIGSVLLNTDDPIHDTLLRLNFQVVNALELRHGVFHAEFMECASGKILFGEIAARPGGGGICSAVQYACNVDLMSEHLRLSLRPEDRAIVPGCRARPERKQLFFGWLILPLVSGRIRSLTARAELESFPSVIGIEQHLEVGDLVAGEDHPYRGAYTVYLALPSIKAFLEECHTVLSIHHYEID